MADELVFSNPNLLQIDGGEYSFSSHSLPSLHCPHCKHTGIFSSGMPNKLALNHSKRATKKDTRYGVPFNAFIAICPNHKCHGIVFVSTRNDSIALAMPPELVDFSIEGLPEKLIKTLEEAIKCHASGAYRASAMMVRRLLEEICDENKATGKTLHDRLTDLKSKIVLPEVLFQAMSELKALGNDAAHIEAKAYENIGKDEAEDSLELAKEILKALYQLQGLVGRLQARKKTP
jgi:hypothetical protein